ncbi:MAG: hypothetical protein ACM30E_10460 [Nitrososphaerales archaeon]
MTGPKVAVRYARPEWRATTEWGKMFARYQQQGHLNSTTPARLLSY